MTDAIEIYTSACGVSGDTQPHLDVMIPWITANPDAMDAIITCADKLKSLFPAPANKLCDPAADWYKASTALANLIRPKGWWVVQYMAPFARMGLCGKVFFVHLATKTVLFGKRAASMRDKPGFWDLPAGNWEYGESASDTARREGGTEINWCVPFELSKAPFMSEVYYLDYGGEKGRAHVDMCYMVFVDEQFTPETNNEMDDWGWLTEKQIIGANPTYNLAFIESVNGSVTTAAYETINARSNIIQLADVAAQRKLTAEEAGKVRTFAKVA